MDVKELSAKLAAQIMKFEQEEMNAHPGEVTVIVEGDLVMVHIKEVLSPSERVLAQTEAGQTILQRFNNLLFNEGSVPSIKDQVSQTLKRTVLDIQTSLSPLTGSLVVIFMLEKALEIS